jgi:hypothetical protein
MEKRKENVEKRNKINLEKNSNKMFFSPTFLLYVLLDSTSQYLVETCRTDQKRVLCWQKGKRRQKIM